MTVMPRSRSTDQRFYGVVEGLVVENEDPDEEGRVKVQFPWFSENDVSTWCRVAQLYAGNGYGSLFVPEVGDEVFVSFIHGDMRIPIIIGGAYNGSDKPSTSRSASADQKVIRTRTGHQIVFDESKGAELLTIETAGGHTLTLDDAGSQCLLRTSGGNEIILSDGDGSISVRGQSKLLLDAPEIEITASASVTVTSPSIGLN